MAAPSAALAGVGWRGPATGREENDRDRARRAAVVALPACSMKLPLLSLNAFNCTRRFSVRIDDACRV